VEQANHFNPPTWFGKDVTYDNRFKNNQLAKLGLPPL
jgi:CYTH domain-containing protein